MGDEPIRDGYEPTRAKAERALLTLLKFLKSKHFLKKDYTIIVIRPTFTYGYEVWRKRI